MHKKSTQDQGAALENPDPPWPVRRLVAELS